MTDKMLNAALEWAAAGYHIFPCGVGAKEPAIKGGLGLHDATTDPEIIRSWWALNPDFNIGVAPHASGMCVVDVDPPLGEDTLARLELEHETLPSTFVVRTPRGGRHIWFVGELPSTVNRLGPKLDTRGVGGYVLLPPSTVEGKSYDICSQHGLADLPRWIGERALLNRERQAATGEDLDQLGNVERASELLRSYARSGHVAVEGEGGDNRTYAIAAEVLNLGLTPEKAHELIAEIWNPHCVPPWDETELAQKVVNAARYAQNAPGAWATGSADEVFAHMLGKEQQAGLLNPANNKSKFYPRDESEQDNLSEPTWLVDNMIPAESTVLWYGESGSFKSFLALDMGLTLAAGLGAYGASPQEPIQVVYVGAEGARAIARRRRPAWRLARQIERPTPFYVVDTMPLVARPQEVVEAAEAIKARGLKPGLIVLDTLARAMAGMNENDAMDAGLFIEAIEMLKRAFGCTVLVVHHSGKDTHRGARGSSALFAGFDAAFEITRHEKTKAVAIRCKKQKDADEPETPWTFLGHEIGGSLVFDEIGTSEWAEITAAVDPIAPTKIGAALRELGAVGEERAVTAMVLASTLVPGDEPNRELAIGRMSRALAKGQKDRLAGYVTERGWCLPS